MPGSGREPEQSGEVVGVSGELQRGGRIPQGGVGLAPQAVRRRALGGGQYPDRPRAIDEWYGQMPRGRIVLPAGAVDTAQTVCEDHPSVAHSLNNLAVILQEQGDFNGAETMFRDALKMRCKTLGEGHPEVGASQYSLGVLLYLKGE